MGYFDALDIAASGLSAQRLRMDIISENIANISTTRTSQGIPYRRKVVVFEAQDNNVRFSELLTESGKKNSLNEGGGVKATKIVEDPSPFKKVYDPGHPDSNEEGFVEMPNVDTVTEMINMISASRSYEANVTSINATKSIALKALEIGR